MSTPKEVLLDSGEFMLVHGQCVHADTYRNNKREVSASILSQGESSVYAWQEGRVKQVIKGDQVVWK